MLKIPSRKPHLLKIIPPLENSIVVKGDEIAWDNLWQYHPELELLYCIKGKGTNFIGNSIRNIEEGELLLFGKNLPHTRQRDSDFYLHNSVACPETIVIQFREDFLGEMFFNVKEFFHIQELIKRACRGLKFFDNTKDLIAERLTRTKKLQGASLILELLGILDTLATT